MFSKPKFKQFLDGTCTWAEAAGTTAEQATQLMQVGVGYLATGRLTEAERMFRCLAEVNPKDPDVHALLGSALQAQEKYAEAVASFGNALNLEPAHVVALAGRGELRRKLGDEQGLVDLKRAAQLDPMGRTASGKRAGQLIRAITFRPAAAR